MVMVVTNTIITRNQVAIVITVVAMGTRKLTVIKMKIVFMVRAIAVVVTIETSKVFTAMVEKLTHFLVRVRLTIMCQGLYLK